MAFVCVTGRSAAALRNHLTVRDVPEGKRTWHATRDTSVFDLVCTENLNTGVVVMKSAQDGK
jgi:hypothetical protein